MSGLLGSLQSARTGMSVSQASIQTTSHNINNLNTPGYSRQRVDQKARSAYSYPGYNSQLGAGQLGTGVEASDVIRIRNTFYDFQFRSESHNYGETNIKYDYYKNMETIFNEPSDTAISASLNNFFNGWHELSKDPDSVGAKNVVIENAKYLVNNINKVHEKLDSLQDSLSKQQDNIMNDINNMLSNLEELNKNIKIVEGSGKTPNDLLDERDRILDDLSFKMNLNNPKVQDLIKDGNFSQDDLKEMQKLVEAGDEVSGELAGTIKMGKELESYKNQIGELAQGIADGVNKIYKDTDGDGVLSDDEKKNPNLFEVETVEVGIPPNVETKFVKMKLNKDIEKDPSNLKMTADMALKMYNLKNEKVKFGKAPNEKEMTINNLYNNMVQNLGQSSQAVIREEKNQSQMLLSIDNSRKSVSGVSMDEEMINLIQFQHAYNASAKVVSTIDSLLDVVVNGLVR